MTAAPDGGAGLGPGARHAEPHRLAGFWAAALGYEHVRRFGSYEVLMAGDGSGRRFLLQAVPEPKRHKNRMHLVMADPEGNEFCGCSR